MKTNNLYQSSQWHSEYIVCQNQSILSETCTHDEAVISWYFEERSLHRQQSSAHQSTEGCWDWASWFSSEVLLRFSHFLCAFMLYMLFAWSTFMLHLWILPISTSAIGPEPCHGRALDHADGEALQSHGRRGSGQGVVQTDFGMPRQERTFGTERIDWAWRQIHVQQHASSCWVKLWHCQSRLTGCFPSRSNQFSHNFRVIPVIPGHFWDFAIGCDWASHSVGLGGHEWSFHLKF